jgi:BirA family biotin operon repressor/biotin-[acetyl-CoA-carboxylase] ligase
MPDAPLLDLQQVQRMLQAQRIGRHFHHEVECTSTNDIAKEMLHSGAPNGTVVVAESQTAGRGRFQRPWTSAPGHNLLFSTIVRWPRDGFAGPWLTLAGALSVRAAVQGLYSLKAFLKWPNDVVLTLGDGLQKLAGVLTEATTLGPDEQGAVIGIGLNVNQVWLAAEQDPERPRVSLAAALGRVIDREPLLATCLLGFDERFQTLLESGSRSLVSEARASLTGIGKPARVVTPGREWRGTLIGIDDDYHLLMQDVTGNPQRISVGEVLSV